MEIAISLLPLHLSRVLARFYVYEVFSSVTGERAQTQVPSAILTCREFSVLIKRAGALTTPRKKKHVKGLFRLRRGTGFQN